jgi:hypothetical protein
VRNASIRSLAACTRLPPHSTLGPWSLTGSEGDGGGVGQSRRGGELTTVVTTTSTTARHQQHSARRGYGEDRGRSEGLRASGGQRIGPVGRDRTCVARPWVIGTEIDRASRGVSPSGMAPRSSTRVADHHGAGMLASVPTLPPSRTTSIMLPSRGRVETGAGSPAEHYPRCHK